MSNIIVAIKNIIDNQNYILNNSTNSSNRVHSMGESLEAYIKDAFASSFNLSEAEADEKRSEVFSYLGNNTNPPDAIIKCGDAIEVKKNEYATSELQLNSSFPKDKLYSSNPSITEAARTCENWDIKDMLYCIGLVVNNNLKRLWMVYGDCFCANSNVYSSVKERIIEGIRNIEGLNFSTTQELGRINNVDPLSLTNLRIRGMWLLQNPNKIFENRVTYNLDAKFQMFVLMQTSKFNSFPNEDIETFQSLINNELKVEDIRIKNPNNPAILMDCKLITYTLQ
mgnify:CR=1 FL=1